MLGQLSGLGLAPRSGPGDAALYQKIYVWLRNETADMNPSFSSRILKNLDRTPAGHQLDLAVATIHANNLFRQDSAGRNNDVTFTPGDMQKIDLIASGFPYPNASATVRSRVVLGVKPVDIASGYLTKKEAHQWMTEGAMRCVNNKGELVEDTRYLDSNTGASAYLLADTWFMHRHMGIPLSNHPHLESPELFIWLRKVWADPKRRAALLRPRIEMGPDGEIHGSFFDRFDELEEDDLVGSVERTFANARERLIAEEIDNAFEPDEILVEKPPWLIETPQIKLLRTPAELATEGRDMSHCSAMYAARVKEGESLVISIRLPGCRATMEIEPESGEVVQLVGPGNQTPDTECESLARRVAGEWNADNDLSWRQQEGWDDD